MWGEGRDQFLAVIRAPKKERGTATLKRGDEVWNFLPKIDRLVKVPSSLMGDSWMGSHITNDDLVALNADDGSMYEMSRGPITDVLVDGIWSENGYTAVRLLSAGSPIRRIKLTNIFGTYCHNVVSFTNHKVHPGAPSTFDEISIQGVFCSKSARGKVNPSATDIWSGDSLVWIDEPAVVSSLTIRDYHRTEAVLPADDVHIEPGAVVENLMLSDSTLANRCEAPINMLHNRGTIGNLALMNVNATTDISGSGGCVVKNDGTIHRSYHAGVAVTGFELGLARAAAKTVSVEG